MLQNTPNVFLLKHMFTLWCIDKERREKAHKARANRWLDFSLDCTSILSWRIESDDMFVKDTVIDRLSVVKNARKSRTWQWASGHIHSRSEECMWRVLGGWRKLKKSLSLLFPLLLKRKKYFTIPSCLPHWDKKASLRSTALVNWISLEPFLRTRQYPALVLCSATAVEALCRSTESSAIHEIGSNRTTYHTKNFTYAGAWLCWCCWRLDNGSQSLKIQRQALRVALSRNEEDSLTISEGAPLAARC